MSTFLISMAVIFFLLSSFLGYLVKHELVKKKEKLRDLIIFRWLSYMFFSFSVLICSSFLITEHKKSIDEGVIIDGRYSVSNSKVAKFDKKEITSWYNDFVFCIGDCINYVTDYTYYYELDKVSFSVQITLENPKLFFEKHLLNLEKTDRFFKVKDDLPVSIKDSIDIVDFVYFKVFVQFLLDNVSLLEKEKLDDKKYLFFLTEKQDFNKLLMKEGLYLEMVRFNN